MKHETESRPFLEYTNDPSSASETGSNSNDTNAHKKAADKRSRLARDFVVFFAASLLWLGAMFFLLPPSSSSSATTTTVVAPSTHEQQQHAHGVTDPDGQGGDYRLHNVTSNAHFVTCGNSIAEARAAGCRYDLLLNHWVPMECVDEEWIDEYQDDRSWTAFADKDLTQALSPEDMGTRDHYYTSIRDHVNHCAMMWRKQFWTLFEDRRVFDDVIVNTYHTEHCASFLSDLMTMDRTEPTLVKVGFSGCWVRDEEEL